MHQKRLPSSHSAKDEIQDQIHNMKGRIQWRRDKRCIYAKKLTTTTDLEKIIGKLPTWALSPFIVPSRDVHSLFWVP